VVSFARDEFVALVKRRNATSRAQSRQDAEDIQRSVVFREAIGDYLAIPHWEFIRVYLRPFAVQDFHFANSGSDYI
jgi:hypothetical protein